MASFLFWNLFRKPIGDRVARLVVTHGIDVLMLAECVIPPTEILSAIDAAGGGRFHVHGFKGDKSKVQVFSRLQHTALIPKYSDDLGRLSISKLYLPDLPEVLLAVAHLPSAKDRTKGGLAQSATFWAKKIKQVEDEVGHLRTVLVGDLNMNPFEEGVVSGHGLHAVMTRMKASESDRKVDGEPSPFFYNPMWGFFGDRTPGPPGTYYLSSTDPVNYFWNIYDQVLVRPELLVFLEIKDLAILDHDGLASILTARGLPDKSCSDHLPLLFRLVPK